MRPRKEIGAPENAPVSRVITIGAAPGVTRMIRPFFGDAIGSGPPTTGCFGMRISSPRVSIDTVETTRPAVLTNCTRLASTTATEPSTPTRSDFEPDVTMLRWRVTMGGEAVADGVTVMSSPALDIIWRSPPSETVTFDAGRPNASGWPSVVPVVGSRNVRSPVVCSTT